MKIEIVGNNKYFGIYYDIFEEYCEIIKKYICWDRMCIRIGWFVNYNKFRGFVISGNVLFGYFKWVFFYCLYKMDVVIILY